MLDLLLLSILRYGIPFKSLTCSQGDISQAKLQFQKASNMRSNGQKNISGLLALADITFQQEDYRLALSMCAPAFRCIETLSDCDIQLSRKAAIAYLKHWTSK